MKTIMFDTHKFEKEVFEKSNLNFGHQITFLETRLNHQTAGLVKGNDCVCCFVNDDLGRKNLEILKKEKINLIALRSAGYNHVDLEEAKKLGLTIVRVPAYSPHAVAEHAVAMLLSLNRKIHKAYARVREMNFSLDGLVGFDLHGKTVGVIGTGRIGSVFCQIMNGFGCRVLAFDRQKNEDLVKQYNIKYVPLDKLIKESDIISLHLPLLPETHHMIDRKTLSSMKRGALLINTSRGALINSQDLVSFLKNGHLRGTALDVYEEEENVFFQDISNQILQDDTLARLITFPNVLLTSHQGFLTKEALANIAETTLKNISDFETGKEIKNRIG